MPPHHDIFLTPFSEHQRKGRCILLSKALLQEPIALQGHQSTGLYGLGMVYVGMLWDHEVSDE